MSLRQRNHPRASLGELRQAIQQATHGLIRDLSLDRSDTSIVVCGTSRSYYGAQLALHAAQQLVERQPEFTAIELQMNVGEHPLRFTVAHPSIGKVRESVSTSDAPRRPRLTMTASA